ncbi:MULTISPECIES: CopG family transcriptional regulator [unclassified Moorena]|uniref:ribbon-helix-helix domain-containing protein n=1 Tax=unclassified Moorena TaxID=2683338 RepID=UPI0025F57B39|nr:MULTISPECIES: CopG family transcriptional regulator [unclassified Moorena]
MKTAISLPDSVFEEAEALAQQMGLSRSELYLKALKAYLKRYNRNQNQSPHKANHYKTGKIMGIKGLHPSLFRPLLQNQQHCLV